MLVAAGIEVRPGGYRSQKNNFPHFMETEGSLPCSQQPANVPYPESGVSIV